MRDPVSAEEARRSVRHIASLSDSEAEQLFMLLQGVKAASDRMAEIIGVLPGEVEARQISQDVEGRDLAR